MAFLSEVIKKFTYRIGLAGGWNAQALSGNLTLTKLSSQVQVLDPGGASRNVTLPAVTPSDEGYAFLFINTADAAETLTVKNAAGTDLQVIPQGGRGQVFVSSAGVWTSGGTGGGYSLSGEVTGTGSSQNTAHGLGTIPSVCIAIPTGLTGGAYDVAPGTHTTTNAVFTVTSGEKYRVLALK